MGPVDGGAIRVELVYCPRPGEAETNVLTLAPGATVWDALLASGVLARHGLDASQLSFGVWAAVRPATTLLRHRDRVEVYRPLRVDPKEARRLRYRGQGRKGR